MENLTTRFKKAGQEFHEQGARLLTGTHDVGKEFMTFVQDEAKGWGDYLRERYVELEKQGWELLRTERLQDQIRVRFDSLLAKITKRENGSATETPVEAAATTEPDTREVVVEDAVEEETVESAE